MSDTVIRVENLSKSYLIGHQGPQERYHSLRDTVVRHSKNYARKAADMARGRQIVQGDSVEEFWALKDVSFEVKRGEVLGIIGRNGAGKSTLLKILSRITEPTSGRVVLDGRVASLLEVGTGFHPELTGRENIFLNGAILGMSRAEVRKKFDEIVAFAEVESFLDTPVKRYSSGMYVRLAFAVAAHLEPEILIVDEVLAVGDAQFQKKCLGKMGDVARSGRTILFVSHQMAAVQKLCRSGIVLESGRLAFCGSARDAITRYLCNSDGSSGFELEDMANRKGSGTVRFTKVAFRDATKAPLGSIACGEDVFINLEMLNATSNPLRQLHVALGIDDHLGQRVTVLASNYTGSDFDTDATTFVVSVRIHRLNLMPGRYTVTLFASISGEVADWVRHAGSFDVEAADYYGSGRMPAAGEGLFLMDHSFELVPPNPPKRGPVTCSP